MGVARWKVPPNELNHPIVEQLVELELDDAGAIIVRPRGVDPIMALKPFATMENPGTDLVARFAREHFAKLPPERDLSPFEKDTFTPILRYASAQFDRAGRYYPDQAPSDDRSVPLAGPNLVITDTWVIYGRPRSENFFTADLERLRKAVEATNSLPGPAIALVTKPADEPTYVPSFLGSAFPGAAYHWRSHAWLDRTDARAATEQGSASRYFFPKPFNDEQIAIVERLERTDVEGVVVQGPPGTGKTHTIANIICHYLATGRRVLVTSKSEGALAVLRDQIPDGIRDLAISLLTSEREGLKQLEATVNLLASKIASLDPRPTERDIADSERRIAELQRQIGKIDTEMRGFAEKHLRRISANGNTDGVLPIELAERIIRDRDHYAWFPDRPELSEAHRPTFTDEDIAAARSARKALGADLDYMDATLPSAADLPDAATLAAIHQDLAIASRIERNRDPDAPVMSSSAAEALVRADALQASVEALLAVHEICREAPWLANLYAVWRSHGLDAEPARPLAALIASLDAPIRRRATIASYAVIASDDAHTQAELVAAVERAASGQRPFALVSFGKSEERSAFASIRILDKRPDRLEEWHQVSEVLAWRRELASGISPDGRRFPPNSRCQPFQNVSTTRPVLFMPYWRASTRSPRAFASTSRLCMRKCQRLFPYGLNVAEIISDIDRARRAVEAIRSEVSRHRLGSARAKLAIANEKAGHLLWSHLPEHSAAFLSGAVDIRIYPRASCR